MVNRRGFIGMSAASGLFTMSGFAGAPAITSSRSPSGRLKFAAIGCGRQGTYDINQIASHRRVDLVALCDVDFAILKNLSAKFPKAKLYQRWREMLDRENPDAVLVATPDFSHADIVCEALGRGIAVYGEKPLCRTLEECARIDRAVANAGVPTQLGTQIAAWSCDRHTEALLANGAIGEVRKVWLFSNTGVYERLVERKWPLEAAPVPETLDWKAWLGSAPARDYVAAVYHPFRWRAWRDFGSGWLGDLGSHLFSPVWLGLGMGRATPTSVTATVRDEKWSAEMRRQFLPMVSHLTFTYPGIKASGGKPFEVEWCDGFEEAKSESSKDLFLSKEDVAKLSSKTASSASEFLPPQRFRDMAAKTPIGTLPRQGRVVEGSDGWLISTHFNQPPVMLDRNMKPRPLSSLPYLEPNPTHYHEFVNACLDGGTPRSDFGWTVKLTETIVRGNLAIAEAEKKLA